MGSRGEYYFGEKKKKKKSTLVKKAKKELVGKPFVLPKVEIIGKGKSEKSQ